MQHFDRGEDETVAGMLTDVAGRVRNVNLPTSRPLLPLFEAVINSIQAIEDCREPHGLITIRVIREKLGELLLSDRSSRDIAAFEIEDNGVGFTDANFTAFSTSDTTYKASRGGKGIGRFVWLVAFDEVKVASTFKEATHWSTREFRFIPQGSGVHDDTLTYSVTGERKTIVRLSGFKPKFQINAPKRLETIGSYIMEHCLEYLIRENPPRLVLVDDATNEKLDLNELFEKEMAQNSKSASFRIGRATFRVLHVRLYSPHLREHTIHYCANNRAVKSDKLIGKIPDLSKRLFDESNREFQYAAYLDGTPLDDTVNQERTDFSMCSEEGHIFESGVSWSQIRESAFEQIKAYLAPYTRPIREKKAQRLERFVATKGPMYRPVLKYLDKDLALLDPDIDDSELDISLYKALHDLQSELRREGHALMQTGEAENNEFSEYTSGFDSYFYKISDINKSDLARYVFDRKLVLQFLEKLLGLQTDGHYSREERIHQLFFPMGKTSSDVPFENHNLWLLDERLAYHSYLASDKQLRKVAPLSNTSKKELDIIVFDKACAFGSGSHEPLQSVTIIEFKRPMRDNYASEDNPFEQVLNYIDEITTGTAKMSDGREMQIAPGVHFYCYVVADKTPSIEKQARRMELERTPDGQGFFGYKKGFKAYVEFISYSKLVNEAKQRNHAFFEKLGLPISVRSEPSLDEVGSSPKEAEGGLFHLMSK